MDGVGNDSVSLDNAPVRVQEIVLSGKNTSVIRSFWAADCPLTESLLGLSRGGAMRI